DGAIWFTEGNIAAGKIGRITTSGVVTNEYSLPTAGGNPYVIAPGPDGALWFGECNAQKIGRITTSGAVTEFPIASSGCQNGITAGPDGALWFTVDGGNVVGRMTTDGTESEFPVFPSGGRAVGITSGPHGALWFTGCTASTESSCTIPAMGRITTAG